MKNLTTFFYLKRTKLWLIILFMVMSKAGFATLPNFTLTVTVTQHETCINNASLSWTTSGTVEGSDMIYAIYKSPDFTTTVETTTGNSYGGLNAGTYRVIATQTLDGESNSAQQDVVINNTFQELAYTPAVSPEPCGGGGIITVNVTKGAPATYALIAGPETRPAQASNVFNNLPAGTYTVSVTDICGNIKNFSNVNVPAYTKGISIGVPSLSTQTSCNQIIYNATINKTGGDNGVPVKYPVDYTLKVYPPGGGSPTIITGTSNSSIISETVPFYYQQYTIQATVTDACGSTATRTTNFGPHSFSYTVKQNDASCFAGKYFTIYNYRYSVAPYNIQFLSAPAGFNPADYNSNWGNPYPGDATFGSKAKPVPDGSYTVRVTDVCGNYRDETFSITHTTPSLSLQVDKNTSCTNECYLTLSSPGTRLTSAKVTAAPDGFPYDLPYTIPMYDNYTPRLTAVPAGTYTFTATDTCNLTGTLTYTAVATKLGTASVSKTENCGNFDLSVTLAGSDVSTTVALQKYYPAADKWGHPTSGALQNPGQDFSNSNSMNFGKFTNGTRSKNNMVSTDLHRVVRHWYGAIPGTPEQNWELTQCFDILDEFTFDQSLFFEDIYAFKCPGGTTTDVGVLASGGLPPLTYRITTKDGESFVVENGEDNLFTGLTEGTYNFEVMDACGNTFNAQYDIGMLAMPRIRPANLCDGQNGQLAIRGVPYLKFKWWKEGAPETILSTKYNLRFTPFNATTDQGKYYVQLTSPNGSSCVNDTLMFDISGDTSNPKAGNDGTYVVDRNILSIDLMDYLSGEYDTHGDFTETTSPASGKLTGSLFSPKQAGIGTYTFRYTVEGLCDGIDHALITIKVKPNYWKGTVDTYWDDPENWTIKIVPAIGEDVEFATEDNNPTDPNDTSSGPAVNDLYVPTGDTKIVGNLINESTVATVIPATSVLIVNENITGSDTQNKAHKLIVKAEPDQPNGTLIVPKGCGHNIYGTVQLYGKGVKGAREGWEDNIDGSPTKGTTFYSEYEWQYFGVPVESIVANPTFYGAKLRKYDEASNGDRSMFYQKWEWLNNSSVLRAFEGYSITQPTATTYNIAGKMEFCDKTITMTRQAPIVTDATGLTQNIRYGLGQNLFGNSYTAAIDISKLTFPDIVEATVYLYNTGRFHDWAETGVLTTGTTPQLSAGNWFAIPQESAEAVWDNQIPSMQGFMLKFKDDVLALGTGESQDIEIPYATVEGESKVLPNTKPQLVGQRVSGQRLSQVAEGEKSPLSYLRINLESASTRDALWLISQEGTTNRFDNGWDGRKYFGTPTAFIFTENKDGLMQVNADKTIDGSIISFYANADTEYELTLIKSNLDQYSDLHLYDLVSKTSVALDADTTYYRFKSNNKANVEKRFVVLNSSTINLKNGSICLLDAYIKHNEQLVVSNLSGKEGEVRLYDTTGRMILSGEMPTGVVEIPVTLNKGIYIVNLQVEGNRETVKIVVK